MSRTRMLDDKIGEHRQQSDSPWLKRMIIFGLIAGMMFGVAEGVRWYMQVKAPPVIPSGVQQIPDSIPDSDLIPTEQQPKKEKAPGQAAQDKSGSASRSPTDPPDARTKKSVSGQGKQSAAPQNKPASQNKPAQPAKPGKSG